jgi:hypothetical protein
MVLDYQHWTCNLLSNDTKGSTNDRDTALTPLPPISRVLLALALVKLLLHCATSVHYGFFRDELYYIQWSERLAWGYVEQPPLAAFIIFLTRTVLGESLFALRFVPAACGAVRVFLTGLMARELRGGRFAQGMAAFTVLLGGVFLGTHSNMGLDTFNQLFCLLCVFLLMRFIRTGNKKLWWVFGVVAGLGLMNKMSMPFFGAAVVASLLLTPQRKVFLSKEIWVGGVIAVVMVLPYVIWLATHDWATLEWMRIYGSGGKTAQLSFMQWLISQILNVHPFTLPLWLAGLYFYFFTREGKPYRSLGWLFVILYGIFYGLMAKSYFLAPAFPMLLAAGAVVMERCCARPRWRWVKPLYAVLLLVLALIAAPQVIPVLPPETLVKYLDFLGGDKLLEQSKTEQHELAGLPQHLADRFGWENLVEHVAEIYNSLPPEERAQTAIFASNYGEAGAIDFFGPAHGLPGAISGHNSYHLWGPGNFSGETLIAIMHKDSTPDLLEFYDEVQIMGLNDCTYCMPYEQDNAFFLCRGIKEPIEEIWPRLRQYI